MKWTVTLSTICLAISGCEATGDAGGTKTFSDAAVPFTFQLPSDFTKQSIDQGNSRGDVLAGAGLSKVDVIAVRRAARVDDGTPHRHEVLGQAVTSQLYAVPGSAGKGYALECQYTDEQAGKIRSACRAALGSVKPKRQ